MASSSVLLSDVQFRCPLCHSVFLEPVSIPCGHSFCFACITAQWDRHTHVSCPKCQAPFQTRPELCENAFAKEMSAQIRAKSQPLQAEQVYCDVCVGVQTEAVKSCLVCLASYCGPHLEPHSRVPTLRIHRLTAPVAALEKRVCKRHHRSLELYCHVEGQCVCVLCTESGHRGHDVVPVEREGQRVKAEMERKEAALQQMIQERLQQVDDIKHNIRLSKEQTRRDLQQSQQIFSSLVAQMEKVKEELVKEIQKTQDQAEHRAHRLVSELQREVKGLQRHRQELERLRNSEDHLHLIQLFPTLSAPPPTLVPSVPVHADPCLGTVRRAVEYVEQELQKVLVLLTEQELGRMQKYAVEVYLDADTANPWLMLSDDRKRVWDGDIEQSQVERHERFDTAPCVLGDKGFTSGRQYWEVEVGDKTAWDIGVARASVTRKGVVTLSPDDGYWTMCLRRGGIYRACAQEAELLALSQQPGVVAVFVDHEEGRVSFFDPEAKTHLYSFTEGPFTDVMFPFFNPETSSCGDNTAPLVIRSVRNGDDLDNVMI